MIDVRLTTYLDLTIEAAGGGSAEVVTLSPSLALEVAPVFVGPPGTRLWDDIVGAPDAFPPAPHGHAIADVSGLQGALDAKQPAGAYATAAQGAKADTALQAGAAIPWPDVTGKPLAFPPSPHGHVIADVTGLQGALDGKQPAGAYATAAQGAKADTALQAGAAIPWPDVTGKPLAFPPAPHGHAIADVTGLQGALDGKAAIAAGVPAGGAAGQVLVKTAAADGATGWGDSVVYQGTYAGDLNALGTTVTVTRPTMYVLGAGFSNGVAGNMVAGDLFLVWPEGGGLVSQRHFGRSGGALIDYIRRWTGSAWTGWGCLGDWLYALGIGRTDSENRSISNARIDQYGPFRAVAGTAGNPTSTEDFLFLKLNGSGPTAGALMGIGQTTGTLWINRRISNAWVGWTRIDGVPAGGTTGQVLRKASNADYDDAWQSLGTMSLQDAGNVGITGGAVQLAQSNYRVTGLTNANITMNTFSDIHSQLPFASVTWHDLIRFLRFHTCVTEVTDDLVNWTTVATDKRLFSGNENQAVSVLTAGGARQAMRWRFNPLDWAYPEWLVLGLNWAAAARTIQVTVESSADGVAWTQRHQSLTTISAQPVFCRLTSGDGHVFLRVTLQRTVGTGSIDLNSVRLLTQRWGDQGRGKEAEMPFNWNEEGDISTLRALTVNGWLQVRALAANTPWVITESGGDLIFARGGVNQMRLTAAGNLILRGTLTQNGVP